MFMIERADPHTVLRWLKEIWEDPSSVLTSDHLTHWPHSARYRLASALSKTNADSPLSSRDLVALLRPVIRSVFGHLSESGRVDDSPPSICGSLSAEHLARASMVIRGRSKAGMIVAARRWTPDWLTTGSSSDAFRGYSLFTKARRVGATQKRPLIPYSGAQELIISLRGATRGGSHCTRRAAREHSHS